MLNYHSKCFLVLAIISELCDQQDITLTIGTFFCKIMASGLNGCFSIVSQYFIKFRFEETAYTMLIFYVESKY